MVPPVRDTRKSARDDWRWCNWAAVGAAWTWRWPASQWSSRTETPRSLRTLMQPGLYSSRARWRTAVPRTDPRSPPPRTTPSLQTSQINQTEPTSGESPRASSIQSVLWLFLCQHQHPADFVDFLLLDGVYIGYHHRSGQSRNCAFIIIICVQCALASRNHFIHSALRGSVSCVIPMHSRRKLPSLSAQTVALQQKRAIVHLVDCLCGMSVECVERIDAGDPGEPLWCITLSSCRLITLIALKTTGSNGVMHYNATLYNRVLLLNTQNHF